MTDAMWHVISFTYIMLQLATVCEQDIKPSPMLERETEIATRAKILHNAFSQ